MTRNKTTQEAEKLRELTRVLLELQGAMAETEQTFTKPHGQTPARWKVMVAAAGDRFTVPQIARRMGLTRQAVQKVANSLVQDGLAQFMPNPDHQASPHLVLTKQGLALEKKITNAYITWTNQFAIGTRANRLTSATKTLQELTDRLHAANRKSPRKGNRRG